MACWKRFFSIRISLMILQRGDRQENNNCNYMSIIEYPMIWYYHDINIMVFPRCTGIFVWSNEPNDHCLTEEIPVPLIHTTITVDTDRCHMYWSWSWESKGSSSSSSSSSSSLSSTSISSSSSSSPSSSSSSSSSSMYYIYTYSNINMYKHMYCNIFQSRLVW